jgi:putative methyltransferase (TIGR04325 family)
MKILLRAIKNLLPYGISKAVLDKRRQNVRLIWTGDFSTWSDAVSICSGYHQENIIEKVTRATLNVKNGISTHERDSVNFDEIHYSWPVLAGLLLVYGKSKRINVLDFGGALGSTFYQNRKFLSQLDSITWNIVEQEAFINIGKQYFASDINFYSSFRECLSQQDINVCLLSSVLQYIEDAEQIFKEIVSSNIDFIILDRLSIIDRKTNRITMQNVPDSIYSASYPCTFFCEKYFLGMFEGKYEIVERFESSIKNEIIFENGDRSVDMGYILKKKI